MTLELSAAISNAYRDAAKSACPTWLSMRLARVETECDEVRSYYLEPLENKPLPRFAAGQHVVVAPDRTDSPAEGNEQVHFKPRCYTLSAPPHPRYWRITVKQSTVKEARGSTSRWLHETATVGMPLKISAPRGEFTLASADARAPLALIAAGIGITPAYTIAAAATDARQRPIWLFLQTTSWAQTPLRDDLTRLALANPQLHLTVAFSRPCPTSQRPRELAEGFNNIHFLEGRLHPEQVAAAVPLPWQSHCYICGPTTWMEQICSALPTYGIDGGRIHTESFGGVLHSQETVAARDGERAENTPTQPAPESGTACRVTLADAGREVLYRQNDGSWLDQLQRQGAEMTGGCRAGSCGSCITRVLKGNVRSRSSGSQTPPEGWVLPCVAEPEGDVTLQL